MATRFTRSGFCHRPLPDVSVGPPSGRPAARAAPCSWLDVSRPPRLRAGDWAGPYTDNRSGWQALQDEMIVVAPRQPSPPTCASGVDARRVGRGRAATERMASAQRVGTGERGNAAAPEARKSTLMRFDRDRRARRSAATRDGEADQRLGRRGSPRSSGSRMLKQVSRRRCRRPSSRSLVAASDHCRHRPRAASRAARRSRRQHEAPFQQTIAETAAAAAFELGAWDRGVKRSRRRRAVVRCVRSSAGTR